MITVTFIRHGESEDNLKALWAGWKDAPLSDLAYALGEYLASTPITHIYASPLLRAHTQRNSCTSINLTRSLLLRSTPICIPEDTPLEALFEKKIFPVLDGRDEKFPEAESLDDLAVRAEIAIRECVLPHLPHAPLPEDQHSGVHVALASHGLCIGELVAALLRLDPEASENQTHYGLMNTAWTRLDVRVRDGNHGPVDPANPPPLDVRVTHVNHSEHLKALKDIPATHEEVDGARAEARAFFGGERAKV
ncbi:histidine phosphatase superfamily [Flammula alnicola]|nr:histidine phosphatase superfamily [Flammula alnicola]